MRRLLLPTQALHFFQPTAARRRQSNHAEEKPNVSIPRTITLLVGLLACLAVLALAQKNELAVTLGGYFPADNPAAAGNAFAIEGSYARRLGSVR
jgi:hypothetical protein